MVRLPVTEHTNGGLIPNAGGVPVTGEHGALTGAIGVSGGLPIQDGERSEERRVGKEC